MSPTEIQDKPRNNEATRNAEVLAQLQAQQPQPEQVQKQKQNQDTLNSLQGELTGIRQKQHPQSRQEQNQTNPNNSDKEQAGTLHEDLKSRINIMEHGLEGSHNQVKNVKKSIREFEGSWNPFRTEDGEGSMLRPQLTLAEKQRDQMRKTI